MKIEIVNFFFHGKLPLNLSGGVSIRNIYSDYATFSYEKVDVCNYSVNDGNTCFRHAYPMNSISVPKIPLMWIGARGLMILYLLKYAQSFNAIIFACVSLFR
jgi:hypothetical protein